MGLEVVTRFGSAGEYWDLDVCGDYFVE